MSFLSPADVENLVTDVAVPGFETLATVNGEISLVLNRWSDVQKDHIPQDPQRVLVKYADRQENTIRDASGEAVTIDGWFTALAPFNAERGDLFTLGTAGDEEPGRIVQVRPARLGTQRAAFRLTLGEFG